MNNTFSSEIQELKEVNNQLIKKIEVLTQNLDEISVIDKVNSVPKNIFLGIDWSVIDWNNIIINTGVVLGGVVIAFIIFDNTEFLSRSILNSVKTLNNIGNNNTNGLADDLIHMEDSIMKKLSNIEEILEINLKPVETMSSNTVISDQLINLMAMTNDAVSVASNIS